MKTLADVVALGGLLALSATVAVLRATVDALERLRGES